MNVALQNIFLRNNSNFFSAYIPEVFYKEDFYLFNNSLSIWEKYKFYIPKLLFLDYEAILLLEN